jgi:peptide chain release factor 2
MQELESIEADRASFDRLMRSLDDLEGFMMMDDLDASVAADLERECADAEKTIGDWEFRALLGGEYDHSSALLTIRSGAGGADAQDWAEMLLRMYLRYAERRSWKSSVLDESRGGEAGIKSATIEIDGAYAYGYLHGEAGIHRLVRLSPFNANSLRQTSFASVELMPVIEDDKTVEIKTEDLRIDTYRSQGAGGQNVNKTESAVRITHIPTGLVAACQSERSQLQNREEAMKMLRSKLVQKKIEEQKEEKRKLRGEVKSAEWGNQIRSYVLHPYTMVKDHRTDTETSSAQSVLDGDLDQFIESELRYLCGT